MDKREWPLSHKARQHFLFAAIPVESWNDALSPWEAPAVWGKQGFRGQGCGHPALSDRTGHSHTEAAVSVSRKTSKSFWAATRWRDCLHLWASTQTDLFYGIAAASPSVWFPGWKEFEQQHPMQAQRVYLSLGDKEEHTKNAVMAAVGDNIRTLHSRLIERGADCTLEWNSGGHFKNADLRTAKAFRWAMEEQHDEYFDRCRRLPGGGSDVADCKTIQCS